MNRLTQQVIDVNGQPVSSFVKQFPVPPGDWTYTYNPGVDPGTFTLMGSSPTDLPSGITFPWRGVSLHF